MFGLIEEYGLPSEDKATNEKMDAIFSDPLQHPMKRTAKADAKQHSAFQEDKVIQDGSCITYRKVQTGESVDATIQAGKYPLHKLMVGKKIGDVVDLMGKRYEVTDIL